MGETGRADSHNYGWRIQRDRKHTARIGEECRTDHHKPDGEIRPGLSLLILNSTKKEQKSSGVRQVMRRKAAPI